MEKSENSDVEAGTKISNLQPYARQVNLVVKVASKGEEREVVSRSDGNQHRVSDVLVGDDSGSIFLTLWDDNIDKVEEGKYLAIKNGYINLFRGSMRLNIGRYGSFESVEEGPEEVNTENNLSEKEFEQERRFRPRGSGYRSGYQRGRGRYNR
jgi:replication factor A1